MKKLIRYIRRKNILINERRFYRSLKTKDHKISNFVHPHLMVIITPKELYEMSEEDFVIISQ